MENINRFFTTAETRLTYLAHVLEKKKKTCGV